MLTHTYRREFSTISTCLFPHNLQHLFCLFTQFRKVSLVGKLTYYPFITGIRGHPSAAMSPVMTYIKRYKALRYSRIFRSLIFRVGIINAPHLLITLLRKDCQDKAQEQYKEFNSLFHIDYLLFLLIYCPSEINSNFQSIPKGLCRISSTQGKRQTVEITISVPSTSALTVIVSAL